MNALIFSRGAGIDLNAANLPVISEKLENSAMVSELKVRPLHPNWIIQSTSEVTDEKVMCGGLSTWNLLISRKTNFSRFTNLAEDTEFFWLKQVKNIITEVRRQPPLDRNFIEARVWNSKVKLKTGRSSTYTIFKVNRQSGWEDNLPKMLLKQDYFSYFLN